MDVSIHPADPLSDDARALIAALDAEMATLYPAQYNFPLSPETLAREAISFFVARDKNGQAIGCFAVRGHDDYAELKRMFVVSEHRGEGVSRQLLTAAHQHAAKTGFKTIRLETGDQQKAAIGLYRSAGYASCEAFADYPISSAHNIFFECRLEPEKAMA